MPVPRPVSLPLWGRCHGEAVTEEVPRRAGKPPQKGTSEQGMMNSEGRRMKCLCRTPLAFPFGEGVTAKP